MYIRLLALLAFLPAMQSFSIEARAETVWAQVLAAQWALIAVVMFIAGIWPIQRPRRKLGKGLLNGFNFAAYSDGSVVMLLGKDRVEFASMADAMRVIEEHSKVGGVAPKMTIEYEGWGSAR